MALSDNLISYWSMGDASGQATDSHSTNHLAETSGTIASATGKVGNCRDFEHGDSEYFTIADNADLSCGDIDMSIAMWINAESFTGTVAAPVTKDDKGSNREYGFYYSSGTLYFYVFGTGADFHQAGVAISTATWYFICAGHSASANEIWISKDAGTPATAAHSTGITNASAPFRIGAAEGAVGGEDYWDGLIDEVGLWKRDIRTDVSELYNSGSGRDYSYITGGGGTVIPVFMNQYRQRWG